MIRARKISRWRGERLVFAGLSLERRTKGYYRTFFYASSSIRFPFFKIGFSWP